MKTKRFLALLLALVMCLSLFMISCDDDDRDDDDEKKATTTLPDANASNPSNDAEKGVIISALGTKNLKSVLDEIMELAFAEGNENALGDMLEALTSINGEADLSVIANTNGNAETMNVYAGMKDGIIKVTAPGNESMFIGLKDGILTTLTSEDGVYEITSGDLTSAAGALDMNGIKEQVNAILTDEILKALEGFELKITPDQLVLENGYYIVKDDFYTNAGKDAVDLVVAIMKAMGAPAEELPTNTELNESKMIVKEMIEALNLKIGYAVKNGKIVGMTFGFDVDTADFEDSLGSNTGTGGTAVPYSAATESEKLAASVTMELTDDATLIKSVESVLSASSNGIDVSINEKTEYVYNESKTLTGITASATVNASNMAFASAYKSEKEALEVIGDITYSANGSVDLAKLSEPGATVVDLKMNVKSVPAKKIIYNYETGKSTEITDKNQLKDYDIDMNFDVAAKVKNVGTLDFSMKFDVPQMPDINEGVNVSVEFKGTFSWTAAPGFGTISSDVRAYLDNKDLANQLADLEEKAYVVMKERYNYTDNYIDGNEYIYKDATTGIWVLLCGEESEPTFLSAKPAYTDAAEITVNK